MTLKVPLQLNAKRTVSPALRGRCRYAGARVCGRVRTLLHSHIDMQAARFLSMSTGQVALLVKCCNLELWRSYSELLQCLLQVQSNIPARLLSARIQSSYRRAGEEDEKKAM